MFVDIISKQTFEKHNEIKAWQMACPRPVNYFENPCQLRLVSISEKLMQFLFDVIFLFFFEKLSFELGVYNFISQSVESSI